VKTLALIGAAVLVGVIAGVFLDVAAFLVARYGPEAESWSFRGNGALAVPFGLGPAILAGAWAALVFRYRGFERWKELGLAAGLVGVAFLLISVLVLVLFNSDAMGVSSAMTLFILAWMVAAPVVAAFIPAKARRAEPRTLTGHLGAGVTFTVVSVVAFYAAGLVLAPGS
jgi:hypothetical protein